MLLLKESFTQRLPFPTLVLVCGLVMWPADQASARKIFNKNTGPTENQCRACHEDLRTFPQLEFTNLDRHHQRVGQPIIGLGDGTHPTRAPGDTSTGLYNCLTCHQFGGNGRNDNFKFKAFRDCLGCHPVSSVTGSPGSKFDDIRVVSNVHKYTQTYREHPCKECHESPLAMRNKDGGDSQKSGDSKKSKKKKKKKDAD